MGNLCGGSIKYQMCNKLKLEQCDGSSSVTSSSVDGGSSVGGGSIADGDSSCVALVISPSIRIDYNHK